MNKLTLLFLSLLLSSITSIAQTQGTNPDSLAVYTQDSLLLTYLKMTKYTKDTSAEAVVLSDFGNATIYQFHDFFMVRKKIKILSEAGLSNGTFSLPLYSNGREFESITFLEAATYNLEDGKVVTTPLNKNTIYEENFSNFLVIKKIAMPNVKVGSVIYISYTIKSPNTSYIDWSFQQKIPVAISAFTLSTPPAYHYMSIMQNMDSLKLIRFSSEDNLERGKYFDKAYNGIMHSYIYKEVPAFKDEAFVPCRGDYLTKIGFQLSKMGGDKMFGTSYVTFMTSWQQFTAKLLLDFNAFGGYLYSKGNYLEKTSKQLNINGKPQAERIKTIVNYVKTNYKWNGYFSYFADREMNGFIKDKTGNSADINLFLTAMLLEAGIPAKPVLISTHEHGKIKSNFPFFDAFNDVVCYVKTDSLTFLLDATEPTLPYYALPPECTNSFGYVVQKDDSSWVDLKPQMTAGIMENLVIKPNPNSDSIICKFNIKASGYSGYKWRKNWNEGYDKFSDQLVKSKGMDLQDSIKIFSLDKPEEPFSVIFSAACPLISQKTDSAEIGRMIFSPFLSEPILDNPLKMPDRKYPVDMEYPHDFKYNSIVVIPAGYKLTEKPAEATYSTPNNNASYSYKVKQISESVIQFTSDLSFNVAVFQPSDYKDLKKLYDLAIKKCKEPIILDKK
jgi:hypothetical protein